jgi:hypothetical protein
MFAAKFAENAGVAQLVEQRIRNAKVGSSILLAGTKQEKRRPARAGLVVLDRC